MPSYNDAAPYYAGEAKFYEIHPDYSRDTVTVATAAGKVGPCTVLGKITASGKYIPWTAGASDGSQNPVNVSIDTIDATAADKAGQVWARGVVLNGNEINWGAANAGQIATAKAALAALGIVVR